MSQGYPRVCVCCFHTMDSEDDLDWHGIGNCVPIGLAEKIEWGWEVPEGAD